MNNLNNYLFNKGDILVAPGGGGALTPLPAGADGQALIYDSAEPLGVRPGAGGTGNVTGPNSSVSGNLASYGDTSGDLLADSGIVGANVVTNAGASTDNALARYDSTTGKIIQNSPVTCSDTTGAMTFPAGGGVIMTAGGAAARKGSAVLTAGTVTVNTTSAITGAVIAIMVTALGTVSEVQQFLVTISNGVSFTVTSNDNADTSTFSWAIVG